MIDSSQINRKAAAAAQRRNYPVKKTKVRAHEHAAEHAQSVSALKMLLSRYRDAAINSVTEKKTKPFLDKQTDEIILNLTSHGEQKAAASPLSHFVLLQINVLLRLTGFKVDLFKGPFVSTRTFTASNLLYKRTLLIFSCLCARSKKLDERNRRFVFVRW